MGGDDIDFGPIASSDDFDSDPEVWDLIVVGAGVAGSAFAFGQAKTGRRVLIIERDLSQPDRIVGELLQPGGYLTLKRLGLESCVTGIDSQQVHGYALFKEGETAVLKYPTEEYAPGVCGHSFHHGRFVQSLRQKLQGQPNVTVRAGTVRKLLTGNGKEWQGDKEEVVTGVVYKASDGSEREARGHLNVVCDGMYSAFRKKFVDPDIKFPSYFVGIILRNCSLPFPNHGHVVLAKPSPILFYPISSTEVRCLVDVPGTKLPRAAGGELQSYLRSHVAPEVPESIRAAFLAAVEDSDNIRAMQNKQLAASPLLQPGALLLGDAFNMRHPLTGGGMTVALADCHLLCEMLKPLNGFGDTAATASSTRNFFVARKGCSATINTLANALYQVFSYSPVEAHEHMRQACFDYLKLGGIYSSGPVSLLSGLNPRPHVLVMHFFMVALFGVGRMLWPPTPHRLYMAGALIWIACGIIFPIIAAEGVAAVFFPALARRPPMPRNLSHSRLTAAAQQLKVD